MNILRQLGFSGRFKAIKIGVIVDFLEITPCIRDILSELSANNIEYTILDVQRIYRVEDGYFDIVFCDLSVGQIYEFIDRWIYLISGKGLLVDMIYGEKFIRIIPTQLRFQEALSFPQLNSDLTYKYRTYRNNEF
jgi:hypothetical protein